MRGWAREASTVTRSAAMMLWGCRPSGLKLNVIRRSTECQVEKKGRRRSPSDRPSARSTCCPTLATVRPPESRSSSPRNTLQMHCPSSRRSSHPSAPPILPTSTSRPSLLHMRPKATPDDCRASIERAHERSMNWLQGQGGRSEADGAEEFPNVGAGGCEAVWGCAPRPCVHAYQRRNKARVVYDCGAHGDPPW